MDNKEIVQNGNSGNTPKESLINPAIIVIVVIFTILGIFRGVLQKCNERLGEEFLDSYSTLSDKSSLMSMTKTYTSNDYAISFKHRSTWHISEEDEDGITTITAENAKTGDFVTISYVALDVDIKMWIQDVVSSYKNFCSAYNEETGIIKSDVGNYSGYRQTFTCKKLGQKMALSIASFQCSGYSVILIECADKLDTVHSIFRTIESSITIL